MGKRDRFERVIDGSSTLDNSGVLLTTYVEAAFFYEVKFFGQKQGAKLRSIYVVTLMTSRST